MQRNNQQKQQKTKRKIQDIKIDVNSAKHKIQINGIPVYSPYQLYEGQKKYVEYIIECISKKQNALAQSPTGTGKTLSLLCSTLSYIYNEQKLGRGSTRVIYTSRTHSQLKQTVKQLTKTGFYLKLAILGSREHSCINQTLSLLPAQGKDYECRVRIAKKEGTFCKYYHNQQYYEKLDIKRKMMDLQEVCDVGKKQSFCPYYYQRYNKQNANLILMPYTYLLDERYSSLQSLKQLVQNSIVIFDQAHNIGNACQSSKQFTITRVSLAKAVFQLNTLRQTKLMQQRQIKSNKPFTQEQLSKMIKVSVEELQMHACYVTAIEQNIYKLDLNQKIGDCFTVHEFVKSLDRMTKDIEFGQISKKLGNLNASVPAINNQILYRPYFGLSHWLSLVKKLHQFMNQSQKSQNCQDSYRMHLKFDGSDMTIHLLCVQPKIGFNNILKMSPRSIILTSGTLSPINFIPTQLGAQFARPLACSHIISKEQVNGCVITTGPNKFRINFSFQNRQKERTFKQLGQIIIAILNLTPYGVIFFVPSYSFLDKMRTAFTQLGFISRFFSIKSLFFQESNPKQFKLILQKYLAEAVKPKGAALFALARGKVSQGYDFSGDKCRAVCLIGVPYPAFKDFKVTSKMQYLDKKSKQVKNFNGSQWYLCQTIRCINQTIGRLIRNKNDYGSIYLIDQRFAKDQIFSQISTWARQSIKIVNDFQQFKFKSKIFQEYVQKQNNQNQQVEHFFTSHLGTKLTNKIGFKSLPVKGSISMPKNQCHFNAPEPEKQRQLLINQLKSNQQVVNKLKQKESIRQKIIFNHNIKKKAPQKQSQVKQCPICRVSRALIKNTQCIHEICEQCWDIWLKKDLRCPICRIRIREKYLIRPSNTQKPA